MSKGKAKKQIEMRRCIACREVRHKSELLRVVKSPDGEFSIDETGKKSGRGAYVCRMKKCAEVAKKRKLFDRAFKVKVPPEFCDEIISATEKFENE